MLAAMDLEPDQMNRELSAMTHPIASSIVSVCPSHEGGEVKFVIGIDTQNENLNYLIDLRSASLLAYGLLELSKTIPFIRVRWDAKRGCFESYLLIVFPFRKALGSG
jgi:hypothetical protein